MIILFVTLILPASNKIWFVGVTLIFDGLSNCSLLVDKRPKNFLGTVNTLGIAHSWNVFSTINVDWSLISFKENFNSIFKLLKAT